MKKKLLLPYILLVMLLLSVHVGKAQTQKSVSQVLTSGVTSSSNQQMPLICLQPLGAMALGIMVRLILQ